MAEYYLVSQLPSLDGVGENSPIPITEERFFELCRRFLEKKAAGEIENLSLIPSLDPLRSNSDLIESWNDGERKLRLALAKARADKINQPYDPKNESIPVGLAKAVNTAVEMENPLEAELFLLHYRLDFLETLRPMDTFSRDYIYYYGLKLKLLWRAKLFDANVGEAVYKKIYSSVLSGVNLEA